MYWSKAQATAWLKPAGSMRIEPSYMHVWMLVHPSNLLLSPLYCSPLLPSTAAGLRRYRSRRTSPCCCSHRSLRKRCSCYPWTINRLRLTTPCLPLLSCLLPIHLRHLHLLGMRPDLQGFHRRVSPRTFRRKMSGMAVGWWRWHGGWSLQVSCGGSVQGDCARPCRLWLAWSGRCGFSRLVFGLDTPLNCYTCSIPYLHVINS